MLDLTIYQDGKVYTSRVSIEEAQEMIKQLPAGSVYRAVRAGTQQEMWL